MEKAKLFTSALAGASKRVFNRWDDKWHTVIDYAKKPSKFGFIKKIMLSKTKAKDGKKVVQAPIKAEPGKESNRNTAISHLEANIPFTLDSYFEGRPRNRTGGRLDPFLDILTPPKAPLTQPVKDEPIAKIDAKKEPDLEISLKEEPQKTNPLSKIRLRGIVIGKNRVAYIEDQKGYQKVTIGTPIAGGKVSDITKEAVIILMGNQQITLTEEGSK